MELIILTAKCPSCYPINSFKAMNERIIMQHIHYNYLLTKIHTTIHNA